MLGISMRETEDILTRDMLASSAAFINCVNGTNGDVPTNITRADVNNVLRSLMNNDAYSIMDNIDGEDKFGTAPVRKAYFVLSSTNLTGDLDGVAGFIHTSQYPSQTNVMTSEYGAVAGLRFLVSSLGSFSPFASALGATVYNNFAVGMESYGVIQQNGYSAQFIYRPAIMEGPLAQNVSIAYKFAQAQRIFNDQWIVNMRSTLA